MASAFRLITLAAALSLPASAYAIGSQSQPGLSIEATGQTCVSQAGTCEMEETYVNDETNPRDDYECTVLALGNRTTTQDPASCSGHFMQCVTALQQSPACKDVICYDSTGHTYTKKCE